MRKMSLIAAAGVVLTLGLVANVSRAGVYPFEIFTANGDYCDDPRVNLSVNVTGAPGFVDLTFYNDSTVASSIARIYFDNDSLLGTQQITNGSGTDFGTAFPGPGNLPGGKNLVPPFEADREFTIGANAPPPENGINNAGTGEWVKIRFELTGGGTAEDVINELDIGVLRIGLHIIAFDDGSSESAIVVPEPATMCLFGLGVLLVGRPRKR